MKSSVTLWLNVKEENLFLSRVGGASPDRPNGETIPGSENYIFNMIHLSVNAILGLVNQFIVIIL